MIKLISKTSEADFNSELKAFQDAGWVPVLDSYSVFRQNNNIRVYSILMGRG